MLTSLFALWCQFQQTFRSINHFIWTAQSCFSCFLLPTKCLIKNSLEKFLLSIFLSLENSVLHMSCYIMTNYNMEWMLSWLPLLDKNTHQYVALKSQFVSVDKQYDSNKSQRWLLGAAAQSVGTGFGQTNWISALVQTKTQLISQCCKTTHRETTLKGLEVLWI